MDKVLESRSASFWREMFEEASQRIENVKPLSKDMTTKGGVQVKEAAAPMPNKKASLNRLVSFARLPSENVTLQKAENLDEGDDDRGAWGHDGLLDSLTAHLMKRERYLATVKDGYDIKMSSFDEFSLMMQVRAHLQVMSPSLSLDVVITPHLHTACRSRWRRKQTWTETGRRRHTFG